MHWPPVRWRLFVATLGRILAPAIQNWVGLLKDLRLALSRSFDDPVFLLPA
jgi:hypothetical protein